MKYKRMTKKNRKSNAIVDMVKSEYLKSPYRYNKLIERLAELEDMVESGQIRILPCKLGDHVYVITRIGNFIDLDEYVVDWFDTYDIDDKNIGFYFNGKNIEDCRSEFCCYDVDFGKTVFLTRAEAETRLEELKNGI